MLETWTELSPGTRVPVDPIRLASYLGINVLIDDLPDNVSGRIEKRADRDPVITLNRADSTNRARFTCAHELGHYA